MSKNVKVCPRCGKEPVDMMDSKMERGKKVCFLCAEDEVCRPGYVRRKYLDVDKQEPVERIKPMGRNPHLEMLE